MTDADHATATTTAAVVGKPPRHRPEAPPRRRAALPHLRHRRDRLRHRSSSPCCSSSIVSARATPPSSRPRSPSRSISMPRSSTRTTSALPIPRVLVSANYPVVARNGARQAFRASTPTTSRAMAVIAKIVSDGTALSCATWSRQPGDRRHHPDRVAARLRRLSTAPTRARSTSTSPRPTARSPTSRSPGSTQLASRGVIATPFNWGLLIFGAVEPLPRPRASACALVGSLYMMRGRSAPVACRSASPPRSISRNSRTKNRLTDIIEVNINNLAAVPSIVFGLLGPRGLHQLLRPAAIGALVGGLVLALMTLPTIIIATRAALQGGAALDPRRGARRSARPRSECSITSCRWPCPGILTGTIIGLARALGETAPLLLIGMVAFVADVPPAPFAPATALPVQIYMWADEAERAFVERTSGAHHRAARLPCPHEPRRHSAAPRASSAAGNVLMEFRMT